MQADPSLEITVDVAARTIEAPAAGLAGTRLLIDVLLLHRSNWCSAI